jgi:hypothetical protein
MKPRMEESAKESQPIKSEKYIWQQTKIAKDLILQLLEVQ